MQQPYQQSEWYPTFRIDGMTGIEWYSECNPWLDVVVIVLKQDEDRAYEAMLQARQDFDDEIVECYGDAVEMNLNENLIPHVSLYHTDYEGSDAEERLWEAMVAEISISKLIAGINP